MLQKSIQDFIYYIRANVSFQRLKNIFSISRNFFRFLSLVFVKTLIIVVSRVFPTSNFVMRGLKIINKKTFPPSESSADFVENTYKSYVFGSSSSIEFTFSFVSFDEWYWKWDWKLSKERIFHLENESELRMLPNSNGWIEIEYSLNGSVKC